MIVSLSISRGLPVSLLAMLVLVSLGWSGGVAAGATLVSDLDDYEEGAQNLLTDQEETLSSVYTSSNPGTTILGGARELELTVTNNPAGRNARVRVQPGPGRIFLQLRPATEGSVTVRYNRGGTGLGGIDLRNGGANGFGFDFQTASANLGIEVTVRDTSGRTATGTFLQAAADPVDPVTLLFDDFNNPAGADFGSVDSLEFTFSPAVAGDFQLAGAGFYAIPVPEPSSVLLLAAGFVGLLGRRRKRA